MRSLLVIFSILLFVGCKKEIQQNKSSESIVEFEELVDIRINENGTTRINGLTVQESAISSHIKSLNLNEETKVRLVFSELAYTGVVNKLALQLGKAAPGIQLSTSMLSPEEFKIYDKDQIHIDVLSSGRVLYNGIKLYPEDLKIALNSNKDSSTPIFLSVVDKATFGQVYDVQKAISKTDFRNLN